MNQKAKMILKNINYTVSANFLVLGISIFLNLIVPKFIGVREYSFWQLYVFYSGYVGFFHFGWLDGLYLKIGGSEYNDLDRPSLGTQFWYLTLTQIIIAMGITIYSLIIFTSDKRIIIFLVTSLNLVVTNSRLFILYILQSTNKIKEYAQLSRGDRYIYIFCVGLYLFFQGRNFEVLIIMDVLSKLVILMWGVYKVKDIIFVRLIPFREVFSEIKDSIKIGSNLLVSNIASVLILGINRVLVERQWSIETFGKLSFTLSISNMFMTFINAVGVVMFPLLRRTDRKNLPNLYKNLRTLFVPATYGILLFFSPIKFLLNMWLPDYSQSLNYMGVLFPIVVYEGRMSLLVNTYLKTIRKEKLILNANIAALILSINLSFISVFLFKDIYLSVIAIIFSLAFRCIFAEKMLLRVLNIDVGISSIVENSLTLIFICSNIICPEALSFVIYASSFIFFLFLNRRSIQSSANTVLMMMKS